MVKKEEKEGVVEKEAPEAQKPPSLAQKIVAVMAELSSVTKLDKMVNGQYQYVSHDTVSEKVHPLLVKHGIVVLPSVEHAEQDGNRAMVKVRVTLINSDEPTDAYDLWTCGHGIDSQDKGLGKAYSYAMKMMYLKLFCLVSGEPDNEAQLVEYEAPEKPKGNFNKAVEFIRKAQPGNIPAIMRSINAKSWTQEEQDQLIHMLNVLEGGKSDVD